jgi:hypothetical protein
MHRARMTTSLFFIFNCLSSQSRSFQEAFDCRFDA